MENLWGIDVNSEQIRSPKEIFEEQSKYLAQMTNNIVYLDISQYTETNIFANTEIFKQSNKFINQTMNFQVNIKSTRLDNYGYNILIYRHNILLYPLKIDLNPDIYRELYATDEKVGQIVVNDESSFIILLGKILASKKVEMAVNTIRTISLNK